MAPPPDHNNRYTMITMIRSLPPHLALVLAAEAGGVEDRAGAAAVAPRLARDAEEEHGAVW